MRTITFPPAGSLSLDRTWNSPRCQPLYRRCWSGACICQQRRARYQSGRRKERLPPRRSSAVGTVVAWHIPFWTIRRPPLTMLCSEAALAGRIIAQLTLVRVCYNLGP
jgi:hypothetical protein